MTSHGLFSCSNSIVAAGLGILMLVAFVVPARSEPLSFDLSALEFFEKQVRPILVERCYECHSGKSDEPKGGLRVDSREALLTGGDTGPAIEPGNAKKSLLIDSINYGAIYQMPPKSKMPAAEIAVLAKWVEMNAPWPPEASTAVARAAFDIEKLKAEHWCWQPIARHAPPVVTNAEWPKQDMDRFILARLEQAELAPAAPADKRTLIRRAFFDLIGLPPSVAEVDSFLSDESPGNFAAVVDRLLDSPHFGERWGRHWLDLMRYAETYGHEFDYPIPDAFRYRDYVIRALNADVPYDQFVLEHLAGDLLDNPRRHPADDTNESVIGTTSWWLGEATHAPVDVRGDSASRIENQIDVMSKTFLGLTVACARCHDHKFDAISTKDYYALAGYLRSSRRHQAWLAPLDRTVEVSEKMEAAKAERDRAGRAAIPAGNRASADQFARYLLAAREVMFGDSDHDAGQPDGTPAGREDIVFEDFERETYAGWEVTGDAFGSGPVELKTVVAYLGEVGQVGRRFVHSHVRQGGEDSGTTDRKTGKLTSREFTIERRGIEFLIGGGNHPAKTCLNLVVDGQVVRTATGRNSGRLYPERFDVSDLRGKAARIEIVDEATGGWGNVGVDHIVFTDRTIAGVRRPVETVAREFQLDADRLARWVEALQDKRAAQYSHPLYGWTHVAMTPGGGGFESSRFDSLRRQSDEKAALDATRDSRFPLLADFSQQDYGAWWLEGDAFGDRPTTAGEFDVTPGGQPIPRLPRVADSGRLSGRQRGVLRSPTFTLEHGNIFYRLKGKDAQVRLVVDGYFMNSYNGLLFGGFNFDVNSPDEFTWVRQAGDIKRYLGHKAYIEVIDRGDGEVAIDEIRFSDGTSPERQGNATLAAVVGQFLLEPAASPRPSKTQGVPPNAGGPRETEEGRGASNEAQALAAAFGEVWRGACAAWHDGSATSDQVELLRWVLQSDLMAIDDDAKRQVAAAAAQLKQLAAQLPTPATVLTMTDGSGENERIHIRGNHRLLGEEAPRGMLTALSVEAPPSPAPALGSSRLAFARQVADPENPLTSRVMVNRVWHHLFGRGIVASTDNFGVLGDEPTHPELLDHLAVQFIDDGWSLKRSIRGIMLSSTYQMRSTSEPAADARDPENKLLHRMNVRRLQGEATRDAILSISGRLDPTLFGPSVPVHITPFMQGRGRPGNSGPQDGAGRRSIYIELRRNFLPPMMLAFDTPIPFNAIGRRNVSNVPAQALILMNDPFVVEQARLWARRVLNDDLKSPDRRIERLYQEAYGRPPDDGELARARAFLEVQSREIGLTPAQGLTDERVWTDLCHELFNVKEFFFVR